MADQECGEVRELLDSYSTGELMVETNHQLLGHLRICQNCREELSARDALREALRRLPAPSHAPGRIGRAVHAQMAVRRTPRWAIALATCLLSIAVAATWQIVREQPVSAAALLVEAATREQQVQESGQIVRRILLVEERRLPLGTLVGRQRVEVWTDAGRGLVARRAYDDGKRLVAGEWRRPDGSRVYRRGRAATEGLPEPPAGIGPAGENWRLDLSAAGVAALVPSPKSGRVRKDAGSLVLDFEWTGAPVGVSRVQLFLRPDDLHAFEQRLTVHRPGAMHEIRLFEEELSRLSANDVATRIFTPDPELAPPVPEVAAVPGKTMPAAVPARPRPSLETEIHLLHTLHGLNLLADGRATVRREASGRLAIHASAPVAAASALALVPLQYSGTEVDREIKLPAPGEVSLTPPSGGDGVLAAVQLTIDLRLLMLDDLFSRVPDRGAALSLDAAATWQSMVRDLARDVERESRSARTTMARDVSDPLAPSAAPVRVDSIAQARHAVRQLQQLAASLKVQRHGDRRFTAALLLAIEQQSAAFDNPWPLDLLEDRR